MPEEHPRPVLTMTFSKVRWNGSHGPAKLTGELEPFVPWEGPGKS